MKRNLSGHPYMCAHNHPSFVCHLFEYKYDYKSAGKYRGPGFDDDNREKRVNSVVLPGQGYCISWVTVQNVLAQNKFNCVKC